jgi:hypothetical protein
MHDACDGGPKSIKCTVTVILDPLRQSEIFALEKIRSRMGTFAAIKACDRGVIEFLRSLAIQAAKKCGERAQKR